MSRVLEKPETVEYTREPFGVKRALKRSIRLSKEEEAASYGVSIENLETFIANKTRSITSDSISVDDFSASFILNKAKTTHKTTAEIVHEMVQHEMAFA
ncbi:MAG: hypothetical protein LBM77_07375 [Spirochaetaceae bacterium]|jgi:kynurenine formamidase|nr:hypothetical protein [Spirochaetaceae bacterium]